MWPLYRTFVIFASLVATPTLVFANPVFMIDVDTTRDTGSTTNETIVTAPGWTSLDATNGNGDNVTVDGVTFQVFSAATNGSRNRGAPNPLTQDFVFDNVGTGEAVGLQIFDLPDGIWQASVWSWDEDFPTGDQIVGANGLTVGGEQIFTTSFTPSPTDPFTFLFDSRDFNDGFGIFTRANESAGANSARFNALQLVFVPEPTTIAIWSLLGVVGVAFGWRMRRRLA